MKKPLILLIVLAVVYNTAFGTDYYCDPNNGSMSNTGTSASPWSTLENVFAANKQFEPGDVIYLRAGYHGTPTITGINADYVTIMPQSDHTPEVKKLVVENAAKWVISGLTVSPEIVNSYERGNFVKINSSASYITLKDCFIYSALDTEGWSQSDWENRMGNGISCSGPHCLITNNHIKNISFGLSLNRPARYTVVSHNVIENVLNDGVRGLSDYGKFEYNTVKNFYVSNSNHDDIFQSWSGGSNGVPVGADTVTGIELRGNLFISHTDPDQPLITHPQGIGCFDGVFKDWIIENNLIVTEHWHGISLYGAINCKIVNNTLVENPLDLADKMVPWIKVTAHKNNTPATGNLVRNNITSSMKNDDDIGTVDHNIVTKDYTDHFVDYAAFDFHLKEGSDAIDAGSDENTPVIDLEQNTRTKPYDIGCYEKDAVTGITYSAPDNTDVTRIYPNPVQDVFFVDLGEGVREANIELLDLTGKLLHTQSYDNVAGMLKVEVHHLTSGVYVVRIVNGGVVANRKLVVND